jgi:hypothetical protein
MYFDETVTGVRKAIEEAGKAIKDRGAGPLLKGKSHPTGKFRTLLGERSGGDECER